jgi:hypothetical protein
MPRLALRKLNLTLFVNNLIISVPSMLGAGILGIVIAAQARTGLSHTLLFSPV